MQMTYFFPSEQKIKTDSQALSGPCWFFFLIYLQICLDVCASVLWLTWTWCKSQSASHFRSKTQYLGMIFFLLIYRIVRIFCTKILEKKGHKSTQKLIRQGKKMLLFYNPALHIVKWRKKAEDHRSAKRDPKYMMVFRHTYKHFDIKNLSVSKSRNTERRWWPYEEYSLVSKKEMFIDLLPAVMHSDIPGCCLEVWGNTGTKRFLTDVSW